MTSGADAGNQLPARVAVEHAVGVPEHAGDVQRVDPRGELVFFSRVDEDYIRDSFNLYGLKKKVPKYKYLPYYQVTLSK